MKAGRCPGEASPSHGGRGGQTSERSSARQVKSDVGPGLTGGRLAAARGKTRDAARARRVVRVCRDASASDSDSESETCQ